MLLVFILKSTTKLLNMALSSHNHGRTFDSRQKDFLAVLLLIYSIVIAVTNVSSNQQKF